MLLLTALFNHPISKRQVCSALFLTENTWGSKKTLKMTPGGVIVTKVTWILPQINPRDVLEESGGTTESQAITNLWKLQETLWLNTKEKRSWLLCLVPPDVSGCRY